MAKTIKYCKLIVNMSNKYTEMKKIILFINLMFLSTHISLFAQSTAITLSGSSYTETFDGIGSGVPSGWTIKTATTATSSGTTVALTPAPTLWNVTSGRFNNYASGDIGETGDQNASADRALGIRQTGSFGDPGGAFVLKIANTFNLNSFNLSFKLQSLDKTSTRTSAWGVDYAVGDSTLFTSAITSPNILSTGGSTFSNQTISVNFGAALDNKNSNVWIRIRSISASTGSGNRPSTAIDDFTLTYMGGSGSNTPSISFAPSSLSFSNTEGLQSEVKSYTLQGSNLTDALVITAPLNFEISTNNASGFGNSLSFLPSAGTVSSKMIFVRMQSAIKGTFNGNISHSSTGLTTQNVTVSGSVSAQVTISTIASAKTRSDSTFVAVAGRLTVTTQFGGRLIYLQDHTAGVAVFGETTTSFPATWQIGDSVLIAGMMLSFNGLKEIVNITQATLIGGQINKPIIPTIITADQQINNEGRLVTIKEANLIQTGTFSNNTNYDFADCNNIYTILRTNGGSFNTLVSKDIPKNTRDITGIMGIFNNTPQLLPRSLTDIAPVSSNQCIIRGICPPTAVLTPDNNLDRNKTFDVAAWNAEWLGHLGFGPGKEQLQQDNVKCVIEKLKSDIIVLSEICDTSLLRALIPTGYDYKCSSKYYSHFFDTPETTADPAQKVCVVYNKTTVSPIDSECKAILTTNAIFTSNSPNNNFWASGRLPYLFTANATLDGITRKVRVVGIHAKSGSALEDYNRRLIDVNALKKELDDNYSKDMVIIAGDFNDDLDTSITLGQASSYANFVRDTANYRGLTKVLSDAKRRSTVTQTEMVDHIMISNELFSAYENNTVDVASATAIDFIKAYRSATTDHYPVWARFDLKRTAISAVQNFSQFGKLDVQISPNPSSGTVAIQVKTDKIADAEIAVYNILGQLVLSSIKSLTNDSNILHIDMQNLKGGVYHFFVKQGDKAKIIKVVKL